MTWFDDALATLPGPDEQARAAVRQRAGEVLRPAGALRRLDELAAHVAAWQASTTPVIRRPKVLVFAADHGVVAGGVSAYPADVTGAMVDAVRRGSATINVLADAVGATVEAVDVGVGQPTGDIRHEPAMSSERFDGAVATAVESVDAAVAAGTDLLVLGELGIGNTTAAATIAARLLGLGSAEWVGRGTGVDDDGLARKREAVEAAVRRTAALTHPIEVLREVGGAELVAMAAACVRAREHRVPVVLDGYVATAAVLPVQLVRTDGLAHCIAGHRSAEPGHGRLLDHLGLEPLLTLDMRLGEGSGALAAVPLVRMACHAVVDVPTFDEWFGDGLGSTG